MRRAIMLAVSILCVLPATAYTQSILMSGRPDFAGCSVEPPPFGGFTTVYVGHTDLTQPGITGAELRLDGLPQGYFGVPHASPASNVVLGNLLVEGANIAFPSCQSGPTMTLLFTVSVARIEENTGPVAMTVKARTTPTNPFFDCPLVTLCDAPVYTKLCVRGGGIGPPGGSVPSPADPNPAHQATDVMPGARTLSWEINDPVVCCGLGVPFTIIRFGTSPDPPVMFPSWSSPPYEVDLQPNTTYYWQVTWTPDTDCAATEGPTWSFTTGAGPVDVESKSWSGVKSVFR